MLLYLRQPMSRLCSSSHLLTRHTACACTEHSLGTQSQIHPSRQWLSVCPTRVQINGVVRSASATALRSHCLLAYQLASCGPVTTGGQAMLMSGAISQKGAQRVCANANGRGRYCAAPPAPQAALDTCSTPTPLSASALVSCHRSTSTVNTVTHPMAPIPAHILPVLTHPSRSAC